VPRPSKIDRLPAEIRDEIGRLRDGGRTIDEILAHLRTMGVGEEDVSRTGLGRHIKGLAELGEKMRQSRALAEGLVRQLGDAPESKTARLNIELMHSVILDLFMKAEDGTVDEDGKAALAGNPMGAMMLAKALEHLTKASRHDVEFIEKVEKRATDRARKGAAAAMAAAAKAQGLSAEMIDTIKKSILGVG